MAEDKQETPEVEAAGDDREVATAPAAATDAPDGDTPAAAPEPKPDSGAEAAAESTSDGGAEAAAEPKSDGGAEPAADGTAGDARGRRAPKARGVTSGLVHIRATFNNTTVAITDMRGNVLSWSTAGRSGFKGSRKSTAFAATTVAQDAARQAVAKGMHEVEVRVQGAGSGRESAIRAIQSAGLNVTGIKDMTPMPHNGCRPRKRRRV